MPEVIAAQNLHKHFRKVQALDGLDLLVPEHSVYAFVGPNGAGKTTTIKVLMNIVRATSGAASVLGIPSQRLRGRDFARIGYVSENQEIPEWMRVEEFLAYLRPFYSKWDVELERRFVQQFELPPRRRLRELSRGMRMKATLVGALAFHPELIVLDEPFTGLDPLVRDEFIQALVEISKESTIFVSSHDLGEIESIATHIGYIEAGRLRVSEELSSLVARFRAVEATFENAPAVSATVLESWMQVQRSDGAIRFIDSCFDAQHTAAELRRLFGEPRSVSAAPMSLREIFVAMAKTARQSG